MGLNYLTLQHLQPFVNDHVKVKASRSEVSSLEAVLTKNEFASVVD